MSVHTSATSSTRKSPSTKTVFSTKGVVLQLADTTWRIAVPVLLFAGIGLAIDKKLGSGPWLTLGGMALGFVIAGLLIKEQVDTVMRGEDER